MLEQILEALPAAVIIAVIITFGSFALLMAWSGRDNVADKDGFK